MSSFLPESKEKEKLLLGVLRGMNKEIFELLHFLGNLAEGIMFLIINSYDKFFLKVDLLRTLENVRGIYHRNEDFITEEELGLWKTITGIRIIYSYLIKFEECRHVSNAINIGVCGNQGVVVEEFLEGIKKISENNCNEIAGKLFEILEEFMGNFFSKILSLDTSKMKGKIVDCVDSYIKEFETKEHNIYLQVRS